MLVLVLRQGLDLVIYGDSITEQFQILPGLRRAWTWLSTGTALRSNF